MAMLVGVVCSGLSALVVEGVVDAGDVIVVRASTRGEEVACPSCGTPTGRVHAFHERVPADVPVGGRPGACEVTDASDALPCHGMRAGRSGRGTGSGRALPTAHCPLDKQVRSVVRELPVGCQKSATRSDLR
ncbi:transposase family protein [Actinosynnema sp. NPDC051121]